MRRLGIAVRRPHELLAVRRKHRESVKAIAVSHTFESRPVRVNQPQFKVAHAAGSVALYDADSGSANQCATTAAAASA